MDLGVDRLLSLHSTFALAIEDLHGYGERCEILEKFGNLKTVFMPQRVELVEMTASHVR